MAEVLVSGDVVNAYRILFGSRDGVSHISIPDHKAVRRAYRQKVKLFHPDLAVQSAMSEERLKNIFLKISRAYDILSAWLCEEDNQLSRQTGSAFTKAHKWEPVKPNVPVASSVCFDENYYYMQGLPKRKLRFGEYLFYSGKINWQTFMDALVYQCQVRPMIGQLCVDSGFIDNNDVVNIMNNRNLLSLEKFGEAAYRLGYITKQEISYVLKKQYKIGQPFGKYFIDKGIMSASELQKNLTNFHYHNMFVSGTP